MKRGEIWWASLPEPTGSGPGFRRPVLVVQSNPFNSSRIATVVVAAITSNLRLSAAPGNARITKRESGLGKASVVNVSQVLTLDRTRLTEQVRRLSEKRMLEIDQGLRVVLGL
ncbi:type II toxin-antitoxin system PemK/MazF family toxin [Wenzhouxiangella sp. AB-CW3]|uniref:type II toxin-antitoxin system PemK/MazF family toxin n=1 Tax=Wenzhouxiangella sp. AB-CW3 TaxID=2771012 RepID=UPI00168AC0B3|nr:type II toxin-antitoxin system PemK/MazF family toxin [Wenzhouxiangella sp. AB-CW3]QOC24081.1 type II toxin-antitoxin system PemK/MazF family toxin [Wenzhouxiangella sp. AB-CW3]